MVPTVIITDTVWSGFGETDVLNSAQKKGPPWKFVFVDDFIDVPKIGGLYVISTKMQKAFVSTTPYVPQGFYLLIHRQLVDLAVYFLRKGADLSCPFPEKGRIRK